MSPLLRCFRYPRMIRSAQRCEGPGGRRRPWTKRALHGFGDLRSRICPISGRRAHAKMPGPAMRLATRRGRARSTGCGPGCPVRADLSGRTGLPRRSWPRGWRSCGWCERGGTRWRDETAPTVVAARRHSCTGGCAQPCGQVGGQPDGAGDNNRHPVDGERILKRLTKTLAPGAMEAVEIHSPPKRRGHLGGKPQGAAQRLGNRRLRKLLIAWCGFSVAWTS
jgi:hypothetical protein